MLNFSKIAGRYIRSTTKAKVKITEHKTPKLVFGTKSAKIKQPKQTVRITVVNTNAGAV